jgi:hypothetical protein
VEDPRESSKDPVDILCWLISQGYTVAFSGVYGQSLFHVRAVRNEAVLVKEGRELRNVLEDLRHDAKRTNKAKPQKS